MESPDKKCPYCAEDVKAEAIRCKHCQADLSQKIILPPGYTGKPKGMGAFAKLAITLAVLVAAFLGYGAYLSSTPEGRAASQAERAIDLCWKEFDDTLKSVETRRFVRSTCQMMVEKYEKEHGRSSFLRRE